MTFSNIFFFLIFSPLSRIPIICAGFFYAVLRLLRICFLFPPILLLFTINNLILSCTSCILPSTILFLLLCSYSVTVYFRYYIFLSRMFIWHIFLCFTNTYLFKILSYIIPTCEYFRVSLCTLSLSLKSGSILTHWFLCVFLSKICLVFITLL